MELKTRRLIFPRIMRFIQSTHGNQVVYAVAPIGEVRAMASFTNPPLSECVTRTQWLSRMRCPASRQVGKPSGLLLLARTTTFPSFTRRKPTFARGQVAFLLSSSAFFMKIASCGNIFPYIKSRVFPSSLAGDRCW